MTTEIGCNPQVEEYLERLSDSHDLFHVEESWTTFFLQNSEDLVDQLKN